MRGAEKQIAKGEGGRGGGGKAGSERRGARGQRTVLRCSYTLAHSVFCSNALTLSLTLLRSPLDLPSLCSHPLLAPPRSLQYQCSPPLYGARYSPLPSAYGFMASLPSVDSQFSPPSSLVKATGDRCDQHQQAGCSNVRHAQYQQAGCSNVRHDQRWRPTSDGFCDGGQRGVMAVIRWFQERFEAARS
jgi:hypothetical protein